MNIERLKKFREWMTAKSPQGMTNAETSEIVLELIDEAIARQSVTSEEVQRAISHIQGGYGDVWQWPKKRRDTILTALQAYQPTISKTEKVEPCGKCSDEYHQDFEVWFTRYHTSEQYNTMKITVNYCPNCGRKLIE